MSSLQQRRTTGSSAPEGTSTPSRPSVSSRPRKKKRGGGNISPFSLFVLVTVLFWLAVSFHYFRKLWKESSVSPKKSRNGLGGTSHKELVENLRKQMPEKKHKKHSTTTTTTVIKEHHHHRNRAAEIIVSEDEMIDMRDLSATLPFEDVDGGVWKQGWDVQPVETNEDNPLYIYVVPHSHCDPGWIKTFDDYFRSQTKSILSSVVKALSKDPKRKFIWAEISYFEWWWREQSTDTQELTRGLLENGQLEFVTGGWVQPDEANTQLYAMEVQLQEGHDWIKETFGKDYIPKYGWSIDPFGYSPTMAYLLKKYNFEGMLIQRVHYAVKKELARKKHLEFMWRQTWDDEGKNDIFTHVMPFYSYDVPHTCGPNPAVCCQFDFGRSPLGQYGACPWKKAPKPITPENVQERALLLLDQYQRKANLYRSNVVLAPLGDDFRYRTANEAENQYNNYQAIFDYLNENVPGVQAQFGTLSDYFNRVIGSFDVPLLKGAFFTYSDREQDYWSGYFTSRIFDKALDRKLERVLFAAESLGASKTELQGPRRALSLFQHHDGVTGTAKNHVVEDYARRIHEAIHTVQDWIQHKLSLQEEELIAREVMGPCWQSDAPRGLSQNLCGEKDKQVFVYNPLESSQYCNDREVTGRTMEKVNYPCDVIPSEGSDWRTKFKFDGNGMMVEPIKEEWKVWKVKKGGAYLFFPGFLRDHSLSDADKTQEGWLVTTADWKRTVVPHRFSDEFGNSATVLDFIYETNLKNSNEEWFVRFSSDVNNLGVFHTDLNGFNFDTHQFRKDMPIQSQVFPMPTLASIQDEKTRFSVLSEHAQGTASLKDGAIDVWLDRRLSQDDARGLGQGVLDNVPTRTRLRIVLENDEFDLMEEFEPTDLCKSMWEELNHPLEAFGMMEYTNPREAKEQQGKFEILGRKGDPENNVSERKSSAKSEQLGATEQHVLTDVNNRGGIPLGVGHGLITSVTHDEAVAEAAAAAAAAVTANQKTAEENVAVARNAWKKDFPDWDPIVPLVFMVYKRVDYLKEAIESIRQSDFDASKVPIIVSIDGHVQAMIEYVKSLESEFNITAIIHPYSCHDHPKSFPGNDEKLNENFKGDSYGNKRSSWATCCKHHFTWMFKAVFSMEDMQDVDGFFFTEEDYVLAPNFYETIARGLRRLVVDNVESPDKDGYFGIGMDPSNGHSQASRTSHSGDGFTPKVFVSGPMVLTRLMFEKFLEHGRDYCTFDDYNWDWSLVHLQTLYWMPTYVLMPTRAQVKHIGVDGGMHRMSGAKKKRMDETTLVKNFHPTEFYPLGSGSSRKEKKGFGGWGHPADHEHCIKILGLEGSG